MDILHSINNPEDKPESFLKNLSEEEREIFEKLFTAPPENRHRQIWLFSEGVTSLHELVGDKEFYEFVTNEMVDIVTDTSGAQYIMDFVEQYESGEE